MALWLVTVGVLLVFVECNRPGWILPGACGVLLMLPGLCRLLAFTRWSEGTIWLGLAGLAMIGWLRWHPSRPAFGIVGSALLTAALVLLARSSGGQLGPVPAGCCGLLLGTVSSFLMTLAGQAWRAKTGHHSASAETMRTGAAERWGVD